MYTKRQRVSDIKRLSKVVQIVPRQRKGCRTRCSTCQVALKRESCVRRFCNRVPTTGTTTCVIFSKLSEGVWYRTAGLIHVAIDFGVDNIRRVCEIMFYPVDKNATHCSVSEWIFGPLCSSRKQIGIESLERISDYYVPLWNLEANWASRRGVTTRTSGAIEMLPDPRKRSRLCNWIGF